MRLRPTLCITCMWLSGCGADPTQYGVLSQPIINGHECRADEQPATVALVVRYTVVSFNQTYVFSKCVCSGVLIASETVLTAAHCVDRESLARDLHAEVKELEFFISYQPDLRRLTDSVDPSQPLPSDAVPVSVVAADPDYKLQAPAGDMHDLALLFLSQQQPVTPEFVIREDEAAQIREGSSVEIGGWGSDSIGTTSPPGSSGFKRCAESRINRIGSYEIQVGSDEASARQCRGDSGGPAFMEVSTSGAVTRRLVGAASRMLNANDCTEGVLNTRLDAYREWIDRTMVDACASGKRVECALPGLPVPDGTPNNGCDGCNSSNGGISALALLLFWRHRRRIRPK